MAKPTQRPIPLSRSQQAVLRQATSAVARWQRMLDQFDAHVAQRREVLLARLARATEREADMAQLVASERPEVAAGSMVEVDRTTGQLVVTPPEA